MGKLFWLAVILGAILIGVNKLKHDDYLGYYEALRIPYKASIVQVMTGYKTVKQQLQTEWNQASCLTNEDGDMIDQQPSSTCVRLKEELQDVERSHEVLGNPETKRKYDEGPDNKDAKDYFAILQVSRDASSTEVSDSYKKLLSEVTVKQAGCKNDKPSVDECTAFAAHEADIKEAFTVLGDMNSRAVYKGERSYTESLNFVSSPLQLMTSAGPSGYMIPLLVVVLVLWYLSKENQRLNPSEFQPGEAGADLGGDDDEGEDIKSSRAATSNSASASEAPAPKRTSSNSASRKKKAS